MYWGLILWSSWNLLLKSLQVRFSSCPNNNIAAIDSSRTGPTSLSNTQALSVCSGLRQCHNCWLLFSKHCQCFRNSSRQFLLMSSNLRFHTRQPCSIHCCAGLHRTPSLFRHLPLLLRKGTERPIQYLHTSSTPRNLPPLPHTINFPLPMRFSLTFHIIVIESRASSADEERCAEERS